MALQKDKINAQGFTRENLHMKLIAMLLGVLFLSGVIYAADITLKDVPEDIPKEHVKEWVSIFIERYYNAKIQQIQEVITASDKAKSDVDTFRTSNSLAAKYNGTAVVDPVI